MSVEIGQLDIDVMADAGTAGAPQGAASAPHTQADENTRRLRQMLAQARRDAARTCAEGYDD